jgi:hypothetical protein
MRKTLCAALAAATFVGGVMAAATPAAAQPAADRYYYNGRWVDRGEFDRYSGEWRRNRGDANANAAAAGVIGFALGAAIVGSQSDVAYTIDRRDDRRHRSQCSRQYRSYDWRSNTYKGADGYRHYCVR